jgi:hypothetical protein
MGAQRPRASVLDDRHPHDFAARLSVEAVAGCTAFSFIVRLSARHWGNDRFKTDTLPTFF